MCARYARIFQMARRPAQKSSHINSSGSMRYMIGSRKRWRVIQNSRCWEITTSHLRQQTCAIRACGKRGICFHRMSARGLTDAFRLFAQEEKAYTWWDYRAGAFRRNAGLRIDHILLSAPLAAACVRCIIDNMPRRWPQPSDHAPVIADIEI